ncbi:phosphatase PAP2 family protein [Micropruina glycogenica]|nr:phosphatase PAP2 family protein [Micropruina glycogenica]
MRAWAMPVARAWGCLAAVAAVFVVAVWTPVGQRIDSALMGAGFAPLTVPMEPWQLVRRGSLMVVAALVGVEAIVALARRRWGLVLRCAMLVGCATLVTTALRRVLTRPELGDPTYPFNTWPSGHAAASAALIVSAFVLAPPRWQGVRIRRLTAVTLVVVAGSSIATLAHRPSDVIAAVLWVAALSAVLFPNGPVGWRALQPDLRPAAFCVALAAVATSLPWLYQLGLLANGAWLAAAALVAVGWTGPRNGRSAVAEGRPSRARSR